MLANLRRYGLQNERRHTFFWKIFHWCTPSSHFARLYVCSSNQVLDKFPKWLHNLIQPVSTFTFKIIGYHNVHPLSRGLDHVNHILSQLPHAFTPCAPHLSMSVWWRKMFVMILATWGVKFVKSLASLVMLTTITVMHCWRQSISCYCWLLHHPDLKPVRSQVTSSAQNNA